MSKIQIDETIISSLMSSISDIISKQRYTNPKLHHPVRENTNIIYHYTTLEKFLSIINNQSFYFTNLNYLNDRKEFYYGVDLILDAIDRLQKNERNEIILDLIKNSIEYFYKAHRYVSCFSCNGDLLSQWRAYGNHGKGISIGLDVNLINNFEDGKIESKYILYDEKSQIETIEEIIAIHLDFFEMCREQIDWGELGYENYVALSIMIYLENVISDFKHHSFFEEREFRLQWRFDENVIDLPYSEIKFRPSESLIIPFINLRYFDKENIDAINHKAIKNRLPIKEIIIGPSLEFEPNKRSINLLLMILGYEDVKIIKSKIPYRV